MLLFAAVFLLPAFSIAGAAPPARTVIPFAFFLLRCRLFLLDLRLLLRFRFIPEYRHWRLLRLFLQRLCGYRYRGFCRCTAWPASCLQYLAIRTAIGTRCIRVILQLYHAGAPQHGGADNNAHTIRGLYRGFQPRGHPAQLLICLLLIFQAAHQSAAGSGDFGRVEGQVLLLCHVDGHRLEIIQKRRAAQRPAADTQSAQYLCLIAHADLPQLNAGTEYRSQILDQFTEIHTAIRGEVKQYLVQVKRIFHRNQLHIQLVLSNFLFTDMKRFLRAFLVGLHNLRIGIGCHTNQLFQRLDHFPFGDIPVCQRYLAIFHAPCGFHNNMLANFGLYAAGVKIIYFSDFFKSDSNNLSQNGSSCLSRE